jgi:hypothetical protein
MMSFYIWNYRLIFDDNVAVEALRSPSGSCSCVVCWLHENFVWFAVVLCMCCAYVLYDSWLAVRFMAFYGCCVVLLLEVPYLLCAICLFTAASVARLWRADPQGAHSDSGLLSSCATLHMWQQQIIAAILQCWLPNPRVLASHQGWQCHMSQCCVDCAAFADSVLLLVVPG